MALSNSSISITPGSGETVATQTADGKKHQVVVVADSSGHIVGSSPIYCYNIPSQVHVATANTVHWDMFNATTDRTVRVLSIRQKPDIVTAVTGIAFSWKLARTTAVGTGGTAQTAWLRSLSQESLPSGITCRSKPTGGATEGVILNNYSMHSEETNAGTMVIASMGGLELLPAGVIHSGGLLLGQNQGLRCVQITSSAAGNTGWEIVFDLL